MAAARRRDLHAGRPADDDRPALAGVQADRRHPGAGPGHRADERSARRLHPRRRRAGRPPLAQARAHAQQVRQRRAAGHPDPASARPPARAHADPGRLGLAHRRHDAAPDLDGHLRAGLLHRPGAGVRHPVRHLDHAAGDRAGAAAGGQRHADGIAPVVDAGRSLAGGGPAGDRRPCRWRWRWRRTRRGGGGGRHGGRRARPGPGVRPGLPQLPGLGVDAVEGAPAGGAGAGAGRNSGPGAARRRRRPGDGVARRPAAHLLYLLGHRLAVHRRHHARWRCRCWPARCTAPRRWAC